MNRACALAGCAYPRAHSSHSVAPTAVEPAPSTTLGGAYRPAAANEPGAQRTASGLVILIEREGSGNAPTAAQTVEVHYEGSLVDGTIFDSSYARGEPISFPLDGVIPGFSKAIAGQKVGSEDDVLHIKELPDFGGEDIAKD